MGELWLDSEYLPTSRSGDHSFLLLLFLVGGLEGALMLSAKTFELRLSGG